MTGSEKFSELSFCFITRVFRVFVCQFFVDPEKRRYMKKKQTKQLSRTRSRRTRSGSQGTQAWKLLQDCPKSCERPRTHQLSNNLTNLRMNSRESIRDSLMRTEELQPNRTDVGKNVSDQMLCSVVLKSLPNSFASLVTVFKFSHEARIFADLKRDLWNFDSDRCRGQTDQGTSSHSTEEAKCFKCGRIGHRQSEWRADVS